jgi:SSS family solute:Na+ symporter
MMDLISGQIYQYLQSVQAYISPPIAAVFLLGVSWRRVNSQGAIASLVTGFILGTARLALELNKENLAAPLYWFADINFLHFAIFLFVVCSVVLVVISLMTPAPPEEQIRGLTFQSTEPISPGGDTTPVRNDFLLSLVLIAIVGIIWWIFSG